MRVTLAFLLATTNLIDACLNTIYNNTKNAYKFVEIKGHNKDLKGLDFCPDEYANDKKKSHTLTPGEVVAFGGHYVPTYCIYKQDADGQWRNMLVVNQMECGPRGPEHKIFNLSDVLARKLPGDYQGVYKFTPHVTPEALHDESSHTDELKRIKNPYQVIINLRDEFVQKTQEVVHSLMRELKEARVQCGLEEPEEPIGPEVEDEDGEGCGDEECNLPYDY